MADRVAAQAPAANPAPANAAASSSQGPQPPAGSIEASVTPVGGIKGEARMLCLRGLEATKLPLMAGNFSDAELLIRQLIQEAVIVLASVDDSYNATFAESSGWKRLKTRTYAGRERTGGPVTIDVDLMTKSLRAPGQDGAEGWVCRRSYHDDKETAGTASWDEFDTYMKKQHITTERGMTESVVAATVAFEWDRVKNIPPLHGIGRANSVWSDFTLAIAEMEHDVAPCMLGNRVFPILQLTCRNDPLDEIYVISAPISGWKRFSTPEGYNKLADKSWRVVGSYASVEVFRRMPASPENGPGRQSVVRKKSFADSRLRLRPSKKNLAAAADPAGAGPSGAGPSGAGPSDVAPADVAPADAGPADAAPADVAPADAAPADADPADADPSGADPAGADPAGAAPAGAAAAGAAPSRAAAANARGAKAVHEWRIEWTMATVSDARGSIPRFLQAMAVPKQVAEDVPLFTKWMTKKRLPRYVQNPVHNDGGNLPQPDAAMANK